MATKTLEGKTMSKLFFDGLSIHAKIENSTEPSVSEPMQNSIRSAIEMFELVIRRTEELKLFSINEDSSEISTPSLKYIIAPALCCDLTLLLRTEREERKNILCSAEEFSRQFLERCKDYGIGSADQIEKAMDKSPGSNSGAGGGLVALNMQREAKIAKFKKEKELRDRLQHLKTIVGDDDENTDSVDDETVRKYWFAIIEKWIYRSVESCDSISQEKEILKYWKNLPDKNNPPAPQHQPSQNQAPRNFILTRDKVQASVFGAGYPSLPTMTVEEWFDTHAASGTLPDQGVQAGDRNGSKEQPSDDEDSDEKLMRQRAFDDFKDTHRRGDGNKMNKG